MAMRGGTSGFAKVMVLHRGPVGGRGARIFLLGAGAGSFLSRVTRGPFSSWGFLRVAFVLFGGVGCSHRLGHDDDACGF